jgi:hypothetical protein
MFFYKDVFDLSMRGPRAGRPRNHAAGSGLCWAAAVVVVVVAGVTSLNEI